MATGAKFLEGAAFGVLNDIIAGFRSNEGYASPNKYEVIIHPPQLKSNNPLQQNMNVGDVAEVAAGGQGGDMAKTSMRCDSVTLPGRTLNTTDDVNIHGPRRQVVNSVMYADSVTLTFQSSSDATERVAFEKWQHRTFNPQTWQVGYYNHYVGAVDIYLLDQQMQRRYGLRLWEAFPKTLGDTALAYGTTNSLLIWSVDMNFRYWESLDINQKGPSLTDRIGQTLNNVAERNISRALPAVSRLF